MDLAFRAIFLFSFIYLLTRVVGRRELSSLEPFDLILLIVIGDAVQQGLTQDDYSVTGAVIAVSTIAALQVGSSYLSYKSRRARRVLEGEPIVIVQDGKLIERNLKRDRLTEGDVAAEMRAQQIASVEDVEWGILESNGAMSFIPK